MPSLGALIFMLGFAVGLAASTTAGTVMLILGGALFVGYWVWWLIALKDGQTPGKKVVGIHAVRADTGEPLQWGMMFVREFLVKGILFGILIGLSFGILFFVDSLWPLWDRRNQTLHDKVVRTQVAYVVGSQDTREENPITQTANLASWPIRVAAAVLDSIMFSLGALIFMLGFAVGLAASTAAGTVMLILVGALFVGCLVWWLIALKDGQTPGKKVVGIRAVRADTGEPLRWGMMFVREFLVKGILFGSLSLISFGILFFVDSLWPLWDSRNQTLHDKIIETQVAYVVGS